MAIIEKSYAIPNLTAGYHYDFNSLTIGQIYPDPLLKIEADPDEIHEGGLISKPPKHIVCGPIDLDIGTFNVGATLMTDQYRWGNSGYELVRSDVVSPANIRLSFNHSSSYEYLGVFQGRFDFATAVQMGGQRPNSYDALRTNCVAFQWVNVYLSLPSENRGSPIYLLQASGKSCKGYRELWYLDLNSELQIDGLPEKVDELGAFANAENLVEISIPPSVKKIGRYSFANTSLTSVRIANDCVYYPTSFPQGCIIHFY